MNVRPAKLIAPLTVTVLASSLFDGAANTAVPFCHVLLLFPALSAKLDEKFVHVPVPPSMLPLLAGPAPSQNWVVAAPAFGTTIKSISCCTPVTTRKFEDV